MILEYINKINHTGLEWHECKWLESQLFLGELYWSPKKTKNHNYSHSYNRSTQWQDVKIMFQEYRQQNVNITIPSDFNIMTK